MFIAQGGLLFFFPLCPTMFFSLFFGPTMGKKNDSFVFFSSVADRVTRIKRDRVIFLFFVFGVKKEKALPHCFGSFFGFVFPSFFSSLPSFSLPSLNIVYIKF